MINDMSVEDSNEFIERSKAKTTTRSQSLYSASAAITAIEDAMNFQYADPFTAHQKQFSHFDSLVIPMTGNSITERDLQDALSSVEDLASCYFYENTNTDKWPKIYDISDMGVDANGNLKIGVGGTVAELVWPGALKTTFSPGENYHMEQGTCTNLQADVVGTTVMGQVLTNLASIDNSSVNYGTHAIRNVETINNYNPFNPSLALSSSTFQFCCEGIGVDVGCLECLEDNQLFNSLACIDTQELNALKNAYRSAIATEENALSKHDVSSRLSYDQRWLEDLEKYRWDIDVTLANYIPLTRSLSTLPACE